jgi:hypothetical protein
LCRVFGFVTMYLLRDPDAIFRSYWSLGGRRSYFLVASLLIVIQNRGEELFRDLADELSLPSFRSGSVDIELARTARLSQSLDVQAFRDIVLLLWALSLKHNATYAQQVIDVDLLEADVSYRHKMEATVSELVGIRFVLDDFRRSVAPVAPGSALSARGVALTRVALKKLVPNCNWCGIPLSEEAERTLAAVL